MKKILALVLAIAVLSAALASCNKTPGIDPDESTATSETLLSVITPSDLYPFEAHLLRDEKDKVTGVAVKSWEGEGSVIDIPSVFSYGGEMFPVTMVGYYFTLVKSSPAAIQSVKIPSSVTTISTRAFTNFTSLVSVSFSEGLEVIEDMAFWKCIALKDVTLPSTLTAIGANAFSDCRAMTKLVIPSGVTIIGTGAFAGCTGLTDVTLPAAFQSRVGDIFVNCGNNITYHFN